MAVGLTDNQLTEKLREILQSWPLYRRLEYTGAGGTNNLPVEISLHCQVCRKDQNWVTQLPKFPHTHKGSFHSVIYTCKNCGRATAVFAFLWYDSQHVSSFHKIGQHPPLEEWVAPELARQLDADDLEFYKKALRCRNFNFGLGALAYLRRVVENRMNDILDLLSAAATEAGFAVEELKTFEDAKRSKRFDDKVAYAAKILPPYLKPSGRNPIDLLHDLASEGIHAKSDAECIDIFDQSKLALEYLLRELQVRKEDAKAFAGALKELTARKARPT